MAELEMLEEQLGKLGRELVWPATPNLAPIIRQRIEQPAAPRGQWFGSRWAMAAAVAILALAALLAYPPSRDAIANWLNLHTRLQQVPTLPSPSPHPSRPLGSRLGLGGQTTLTGAGGGVSWKVLVPALLGPPDEVYLQLPNDGPPEGEVTLVYTVRPGIATSGQTGVALLITEARGKVNSQFFGKFLGQDATLEEVSLAGHQGLWIAGRPHEFYFIDSAGNLRDETLRLASNTLLIDEGGTIVRIEGNLTKAQALQIAQSLI